MDRYNAACFDPDDLSLNTEVSEQNNDSEKEGLYPSLQSMSSERKYKSGKS